MMQWLHHVKASKKCFHSPPSKTADGLITILLVRGNVSRYRLTMILLALETGAHVNLPGVEWIQCTAYRLDPVKGNNTQETYNNIDGERVESGPVQGYVHPKAIRYFISPPNSGHSV
jgi:sphingosine kinase